MNSYHGYTGGQRLKIQRIINKQIAQGELASPFYLPCCICGQSKGIREYHCENYGDYTWKYGMLCLCFRCHRMIHRQGSEKKGYAESANEYFCKVNQGITFDPVYSKFYTVEMEQMMEGKNITENKEKAD